MSYQDTQLLINNEWRESASKKSLPVVNPATGTEIGRVAHAGQAEMDAALESAAKGFEALDTSLVEGFVDEAIAADPDAWAKYVAGDEKAGGSLIGRVMKASKGKADGKIVTAIMQQRRGS
jgi:Asp-tRNA(Asn)/Glu-tRNA(Gln) amidotransferase B subunit